MPSKCWHLLIRLHSIIQKTTIYVFTTQKAENVVSRLPLILKSTGSPSPLLNFNALFQQTVHKFTILGSDRRLNLRS